MNITTTHPATSSGRPSGHLTDDPSAPRRFFGVVANPQSYRNLAYLLLGLPLGTAWFTILVTGIAVGVSMVAVALLGIPMLLGLWYVSRACANVERATANALLGQHIEPAPIASSTRGNPWTRLRSMSTDRDRWREVGYLLMRFPVGIATFVAAIVLLTTSASVAYAPFYARYVDDNSFGSWSHSGRLHDIASGSPWSWLLVPAGALAVIVTFHVMNALARACGRWARASLD